MKSSYRIITILLFLGLTGCAGTDHFASRMVSSMEDAKKIRSVWNVDQSCSGITMNALSRNKAESTIKTSKTIVLESLGLAFNVPQLPNVDETVIKLNLNDRSRGVIDHYILISDQDLEPPFAAIVITELPVNYRTRDQAFESVRSMQAKNASMAGGHAELYEVEGLNGSSLEMMFKNRVGSDCFPTSGFKVVPKELDIETIAISRFLFFDEKLVEYTMVVLLDDKLNERESILYARRIMDQFWTRLQKL